MKIISRSALLLTLVLTLSVACSRDTTPPTPPTDLSYEPVNNGLMLLFSWDPAEDGVEFYLVKVDDGYWIHNGPNTIWYEDAPSTLGVHTFEVKAVDKAGNESAPASIDFEWPAAQP